MARLLRRSFLATAAGLGLVIAAVVALRESTGNALTVANRSGRTIRVLEVSLPWQTLRFEPIVDREAVSRSFRIQSDAHFAIEVGPGGALSLSQQRRGR